MSGETKERECRVRGGTQKASNFTPQKKKTSNGLGASLSMTKKKLREMVTEE